jgi:DNA-binding SARP family transcriptional activator
VHFRILGPLEVVGDDGPIAVGGGKRRTLLLFLLVHRNQAVTQDRLIDVLWPSALPARPRTALQVLVSELRRELRDENVLLTRGSGYELVVPPDALDAEAFIRLLGRARDANAAGDHAAAAERARHALALWRGSPLQDAAYEAFAQAEAARLEEIRIQLNEELADAELASGRAAELVPRLEALAAAHPVRERLTGQLMLALYRAGRQADALAAYREARARLSRDLAVEPGPALQELHRAILNHAPELAVSESGSAPLPRRRRRGALAAAAVAGIAAAAAIATALALRDRSTPAPAEAVTIGRRSIVAVDASGRNVLAAIPLEPVPVATPVQPTDIAAGLGSVWVADAGGQQIFRIDPRRYGIAETIGVGADVRAMAIGFGAVWVADGNSATVTRIDPRTDAIVTIPLGRRNPTYAIAAGAGAVWATGGDGAVLRIDPATNAVERIAVGDPRALAANRRWVWCETKDGEIVRIRSTRTGWTVSRFAAVPPGAGTLAAAGDALWAVAPGATFEIWQYDARTGRPVSNQLAGQIVSDAAVGPNGWVWIPLYREGELIAIDPRPNQRVRRLVLRPRASRVAVGEGGVWVVVA